MYMSYALSGVALIVALAKTYSTIYNIDMPEYVGPALAVTVISTAFGYSYLTKNNQVAATAKTEMSHNRDISSSRDSKPKEGTEWR